MVRQFFNEIIKRNNFTPNEWKKVKIKVIDVENVSNYPICSLLALYKLFSTFLHGRLYPILDPKEAEDQTGFKKFYQTTYHLAMYRLNRNVMSGESKCGQRRSTSRRYSTSSLQIYLGDTQILQRRSRVRQSPEEDIQRAEGFDIDTQREQHFRHPERI